MSDHELPPLGSVPNDEGFFGRMLVSGSNTVIQLRDGGASSDAALEVGREGNGYFSLTDGASLLLIEVFSFFPYSNIKYPFALTQ